MTAPSGGGYRFLNPYNFVRVLSARPKDHILGDCPPIPADRYLGLSGRIRCRAEAATPLFIADTHGISTVSEALPNKAKKTHRTHHFFRYDGQPAIPASSLRGMVRSVYEAATNSCFAVFDQRRLSYRLEARLAATLVPARVVMDKERSLWIQLLPGFMPVIPGQKPSRLHAATVPLYRALKSGRTPPQPIALGLLKHGSACAMNVSQDGLFTRVTAIAGDAGSLPTPTSDETQIASAWLCINNQNIDNKHSERVFFAERPKGATYPDYVPLSKTVIQRYGDLIQDYQDRFAEEVRKRKDAGEPLDAPVPARTASGPAYDAGLSRYMYAPEDLELRRGTLVYAMLEGSPDSPTVKYLAPAAVPRVAFAATIGDQLPAHSRACRSPRGGTDTTLARDLCLCPACRLFGWVDAASDSGRERPSLPRDAVTAVASRLRFTYGRMVKDAGELPETTLAILSGPKPTTTRFYLRPRDGSNPANGIEDAEAGYDGKNTLRGRKFYRHHRKAQEIEYQRVGQRKDDQNRTIIGARQPGTAFDFEIHFDNVAPAELGALLWALMMEGGQYHRLGYAKPLGFGSMRVHVLGVDTVNPLQRYESVTPDGGWLQLENDTWDKWLAEFRHSMQVVYEQPFGDLPNIRDILAMYSEPPNLPIHYPRTDRTPSSDGKNYEWFMGNKRSGREAGPRLQLPLAESDVEGLPLLDRYGSRPDARAPRR